MVSLLELPVDVVQRMCMEMSSSAQVAFVSTCKQLYQVHSLDVVFARLQESAARESPAVLVLSPHRTLVRRRVEYVDYHERAKDRARDRRCTNDDCDDDTDALMVRGSSKVKRRIEEDWVLEPGEAEQRSHALNRPFVVLSAAYTPARDDITLRVAFPAYGSRYAGDAQIYPQGKSVHVAPKYARRVAATQEYMRTGATGGAKRLADYNLKGPFGYKEVLAQTRCVFGALKDSAALRRWFIAPCGECSGTCEICPGCGQVSGRWPEAFASCGYEMPCPLCVGYETAIAAKQFIRNRDQRTIDENMRVAAVKVNKWSKEKWEIHLAETANGNGDQADAVPASYIEIHL